MPEPKPKLTPTEQLRRDGETMQAIADILEKLPDDAARIRVLRATAILLDVELVPVGDDAP